LAARYPGSPELEPVDLPDVDTVKVLRQRLNSPQLDILCINEGIACPI
jgi:hypothetical protein